MYPRAVVLDEALQEARPEDVVHAGVAAALLDVGELALQRLVIVLVHGERPDPFSALYPRLDHHGQKVGLVGENAAVRLADGIDAGAGQCGVVDDQFRFVARGQRQGVGQHHPAFGIGVHDLDGGAIQRGHDIAGVVGIGADVVGADRQPAFDGKRRLEPGQGRQRSQRHRAALHVLMHAHHVVVGFQVDAAGVETDALAHQGQCVRGFRFPGHVAQAQDAAVLLRTALGHGQERAGLSLLQLGDAEELAFPAVLFGQGGDALAVQGRGEFVLGQGGQVAGQGIALVFRAGASELVVSIRYSVQVDLFKPGAVFTFFAKIGHFRIRRQHCRQQGLRHPRRFLRGKADDRDAQFLRLVVGMAFRQLARQAEQFERGQVGFDGGQGDATRSFIREISQQ